MAVASVDIQVDARSAVEQLKRVNQQALATASGLQKLSADALKVKAAVEAQQGGFAKSSQVQGVFAANVKNTEAAIRAQIAALRDVQSRVQIGGALYQKAATQIAQYQSILDKANKTSEQSARSTGSLIAGVGRLAIAYVGLRTAQEAVQAGIQREESSRRLQFLAKGYGEIAAAQDAAARAGRQFGLSATESNQQFAQLYGRLRPLNVSLSDIEAAFVGFNTAAKVSGATAAESSGALLQLTQALGSGVLRGQELNSVLEQAPGLVVALTRELGAPISQIRKLAEEGKITSDVVIRALKRAATEGADELAAAMDGPAQAVKNLQNEFENFQVAATKDLLPVVTDAVKGLRELLISLGPVIRGIGGIAAETIGTITDLINAATKPGATAAAIAIRAGRLPLAGLGGMSGAGELFKGTSGSFGQGLTGLKSEAEFLAKERRQPVTKVLLDLMRNRLQRMETPVQTTAPAAPSLTTATGADSKSARGGVDKAAADRQRAAESIAESSRALGIAQQQFVIEQRLVTARRNENELLVITRKAQLDLLAIRAKGNEILANKELPAQAKINEIEKLRYEAKRISLQLSYDISEEEDKQLEKGEARIAQIIQLAEGYGRSILLTRELTAEQQKQKDIADGIANTIGQGMVSAFDNLIQGTESFGASLRKIASGVLVDIANQLLRVLVINQAINAISNIFGPKTGGSFLPSVNFQPSAFSMPSLLPARAQGGSVMAGQPYLVGERGPELFMPGRSGGIARAGSFGGGANIVVNVDAGGTSVQGSQPQGQALGRAVAAAVQAELIKQKRPGGILA